MENRGRRRGRPREETLCWRCQHATGRCSWSQSFTPVEGWEARPTQWLERVEGEERVITSAQVLACPQFSADPPRMRRR